VKALLCRDFGPAQNLKVEEIEEPKPGPDDVCIKVHASGVNFPDILIVEGKYQFKPEFPFAPGAETAGKIISLGKNVKDFKSVEKIISFVKEKNGIAYSENKMNAMIIKSKKILNSFSDSVYKESINNLLDYTINRVK